MKMWTDLFYSVDPMILVLLLFLIPVSNSFSQDAAKDLASEANKALRNSQRSMFSGKLDESQTLLNQASELVEKLKSVDPDYSQLKSLESKLAKQQADLERRMPKEKAQAPAAASSAAAPAKAKATTGELPSAVSRRLGEIDKNITNIEKYLNPSGSMSSDVQLSELDRHMGAATSNMEQLEKYYGDQVSMDHPEIASRTEKLADLKNQIEQLQSSTRESAAQAAADNAGQMAQAKKLGDQINSLYDQYADNFEGIYGASLVYNASIEEANTQLTKLETIEKKILPVLQPVLAEVASTYGTSAMDINNKLHSIGVPSSEQFGNDFERLAESVENVSKSRKATAESIARDASNQMSNIDFLTPDIRVQKMQETKALLQAGHRFDPNNAEINDMLYTIDQKINAVADKIEADIDAKSWQGNASGFAGPGNAQDLAKTAVAFFKSHPNWGQNPDTDNLKILNACVTGNWDVAETNIFGQVIQWRLPIHLAITNGKLEPKGIARVYELSVLTQKGNPGQVKKAPPFDGYWVGNNWMMRLEKLP